MAKDDDNSTAPAEQSSSTPGNPHFIGRHTPTRHNMLPALRQTAYSAREMWSNFVRLVREHAVGTALKDNVERLEPALK